MLYLFETYENMYYFYHFWTLRWSMPLKILIMEDKDTCMLHKFKTIFVMISIFHYFTDLLN